MTEEEKKKKKGVAIVIAVTPHAPKKPEDTSKPDEKMEKAWVMMKDSARYRPELDKKRGRPRSPEATRRLQTSRHPWTEIPEKYRRYAPEGYFPDTPHDVDASLDIPPSPLLDDEPEEEDDPMEPWMDEPMRKAWTILKR